MEKLEAYEIIRLIGRGNFGTVHLVRSKEDGRCYVLKRIEINDLSVAEKEAAVKEVSCELSCDVC